MLSLMLGILIAINQQTRAQRIDILVKIIIEAQVYNFYNKVTEFDQLYSLMYVYSYK